MQEEMDAVKDQSKEFVRKNIEYVLIDYGYGFGVINIEDLKDVNKDKPCVCGNDGAQNIYNTFTDKWEFRCTECIKSLLYEHRHRSYQKGSKWLKENNHHPNSYRTFGFCHRDGHGMNCYGCADCRSEGHNIWLDMCKAIEVNIVLSKDHYQMISQYCGHPGWVKN